jgi:hypothetical protein
MEKTLNSSLCNRVIEGDRDVLKTPHPGAGGMSESDDREPPPLGKRGTKPVVKGNSFYHFFSSLSLHILPPPLLFYIYKKGGLSINFIIIKQLFLFIFSYS